MNESERGKQIGEREKIMKEKIKLNGTEIKV